MWASSRKRMRGGLKVTKEEQRAQKFALKAPVRAALLAKKRSGRVKRAAEKVRLEALPLATNYSELINMGNDALADQLKKHKLLGATGFAVTQSNRIAYVLQLQTLLLVADAGANDLLEGDSGIIGRNIKRKARVAGGTSSKGMCGKRKRRTGVTEYMDYEWTEEEEDGFEVEALVGRAVVDNATEYANQGKVGKVGTVLYRVVWKDYPPDMIWYEPACNLGSGLVAEFEARVEAEAEAEAAEACEDAELEKLEAEEATEE